MRDCLNDIALARLVPAAVVGFFVLGTGMVVPGRPRERNSSVKLSGGPAVRGWHAGAKARGSFPRSYEVFLATKVRAENILTFFQTVQKKAHQPRRQHLTPA